MTLTGDFHLCKGSALNPHVCGTCGKAIPVGPGKILIAPQPEEGKVTAPELPLPNGYWIVICPNTDLHIQLARKLANARPCQIVPLTNDEMSLLTEFMVWPKQPPTA
jgi:hypothetical protein